MKAAGLRVPRLLRVASFTVLSAPSLDVAAVYSLNRIRFILLYSELDIFTRRRR